MIYGDGYRDIAARRCRCRRRRRGGPDGVLAAKQMGAGRIVAMSRSNARTALAVEYGPTDIVNEHGDEGAPEFEMTDGFGADLVLECVGTCESMLHGDHLCTSWRLDRLNILRMLLNDAGTDFSGLVHVQAYLADMRDFQRFNATYAEVMGTAAPVRTTIEHAIRRARPARIGAAHIQCSVQCNEVTPASIVRYRLVTPEFACRSH